jgi:hypothetical protein
MQYAVWHPNGGYGFKVASIIKQKKQLWTTALEIYSFYIFKIKFCKNLWLFQKTYKHVIQATYETLSFVPTFT